MGHDIHPLLPGFELEPPRLPEPANETPAPTPQPGRPRIWVGRGPRLVEAALLEALHGWSERVTQDVSLLSRPFRIVLPSRSLRDHLTAAAVRSLDRPLVGVDIQTLYATALEVLEGAGLAVRTGRELASLVVRRRMRQEPALMAVLGGLTDAHRVVEASVDDLLEAGFGPEHAEALEDALEELGEEGADADRAKAIARIALVVRDELDATGRAHRSQLLERAAAALERDGGLLPASEVWIHGFAEATGRATDLLLAIARACPTTLLLDEPAEPAVPDRVDPGSAFVARLRERFEGSGGLAHDLPLAQPAAPPSELLAAPGAEAEVRAVAGRIRARLDQNSALVPERIGVVARQLGPYAHALRAHLTRLGIPFSGVAASVAAGSGARRAAALTALLDEAEDCPADRWVELLHGLPGWGSDSSPRADLRLGLRHLGAGRLGDVARLEAPDKHLRLPVRQGLRSREDDGGTDDDSSGQRRGGPTARFRLLRRDVVREAIGRARSLCEALATAPSEASVELWDAWLRDRLTRDLGWRERELTSALRGGLASEFPAELRLSRDEALAAFGERLRECEARVPLGGRGGGVALLSVMEARARTFDHLFVIGLNRDVFPRTIREDALLPDSLRGRLRSLLPDLPIKTLGHDEERYLFAQLVSSGAETVLSWQRASDDGRERVRSTFVDRLCGQLPDLQPHAVPTLHHPSQLDEPGPATARELAIWAGIGATREDYEGQIAGALREAGVGPSGPGEKQEPALDAERVASARAACVREYSRFGAGDAALGPYLGFVGPVGKVDDPRLSDRYVTALEQMARCPWKALLEKLLRLEAPPDPLESFPELGALTVGMAVHRTLEAMFDSGTSERLQLAAVIAAEPRNVVWPSAADVELLATRCAHDQLAGEGVPYPGLVRVLADRIVEHVARARQLMDAPAIEVLGAEVTGSLVVEDGVRGHALAFRADLVERADGVVRLTDYKTGAPISDKKKPATRAQHFEKKVARGQLLQAVAYGLAAGADTGRYLYLKPSLQPETAQASFTPGAPEATRLEAAFRSAVTTLGRAWDAGLFPPRLSKVDRDEAPDACRFCELSSACLQGDTGMRQRQRDHVAWARGRAEAGELSALEARHLVLWDLPDATGAPAAEERS